MEIPANEEKQTVWKAYWDRRPTRVPLRWNVNVRIILLDPALNPEGWTFRQYTQDPHVLMTVQARFYEYIATTLSRVSDMSDRLPDQWPFRVDWQNTYDGAYFGAPVVFERGQCLSNTPCLTAEDVDGFLQRDFSRPLENPWIRDCLAFRARLVEAAKDFTYLGRKGTVAPLILSFDGLVTVASVLMGSDFFYLLAAEPEKAVAFLRKIGDAALVRNQALTNLTGRWEKADSGAASDDSIQLLSADMYERLIMPLHEWWMRATSTTTPTSGQRGMHLCGDVSHLLPLIHERLGVSSFDTGFPIDHGALRRALGDDVEISGGPHIGLLQHGTPEQCAQRAREILQSGIMSGGRFILQEGNNLPPCCPLENLAAVYETCMEYGRYS